MKNNKVLGIGEILIRLSVPNYQLFQQANTFNIHYGGGEFNVIAALANLKIPVAMLTKVSNNALGLAAIEYAKSFGIDTSRVIYSNNRMGIYFTEIGFSQRPTKVIYDRSNSAFSKIKQDDLNWEKTLEDISWIHLSGITPALNDNLYDLTQKIIKVAKTKNIKISFDINWRNSLWNLEDAIEKFSKLIYGIDLCIGISPIKIDENSHYLKFLQKDTYEYYHEICQQISKKYQITHLAFTTRNSITMNKNIVQSFYYNSQISKLFQTNPTEIDIVDRIGTGDAFSAGILYGIIQDKTPNEIVEFADACFVLKHTINGDVNCLTIDDINRYIKNKNKPIKIVR